MTDQVYVMILTILATGSHSGGTPAISMHDFASKAACDHAAAKWIAQLPTQEYGRKRYYENIQPRAVCVPKG